MKLRTIRPITLLAVACLATLFAGCYYEQDNRVTAPLTSNTLQGEFEVEYDLQLTEGKDEGTGDTPEKATTIHFYDEYIVLENGEEGGRVIPIRQIERLRWK